MCNDAASLLAADLRTQYDANGIATIRTARFCVLDVDPASRAKAAPSSAPNPTTPTVTPSASLSFAAPAPHPEVAVSRTARFSVLGVGEQAVYRPSTASTPTATPPAPRPVPAHDLPENLTLVNTRKFTVIHPCISTSTEDEPGMTSNDLGLSDNIPEEPAPVEADAEDNEDDDPVENGEDGCKSASFVERVIESASRVFNAIRETIWGVVSKARKVLGSIFSWFATGA